jgi:DNA-binding MarR family transcriptional regulator
MRQKQTRIDQDVVLLQEVYTTGTLVAALVSRELQAIGVPPQYFSLLGWIRLLEPVSPGRVVTETGIPPTTLRDYIRALVERRDVRRVPNPQDGRSYLIVLTPRGRRLVQSGYPALLRAMTLLDPHLARDSSEYVERVRELRHALQRAIAPPGGSRSRPDRAVPAVTRRDGVEGGEPSKGR